MRAFWLWLRNNLSNFFSIVGILVTVYLSIFYVPAFIRQANTARTESVNSALVETVQELVYNNDDVRVEDLQTLIKGKELTHDVTYAYTLEELLILTQDKFMGNRFIPLETRTSLMGRIDDIRSMIELSETSVDISESKPDYIVDIVSLTATAMGLLISLLGVWSYYNSRKKERDAEFAGRLESEKQRLAIDIKDDLQYRDHFRQALNELSLLYTEPLSHQQRGYDFLIHDPRAESKLIVQVRRSVPPGSRDLIDQLTAMVAEHNTKICLFAASGITEFYRRQVRAFNSTPPRAEKIGMVLASSKDEIAAELKRILEIQQPRPFGAAGRDDGVDRLPEVQPPSPFPPPEHAVS